LEEGEQTSIKRLSYGSPKKRRKSIEGVGSESRKKGSPHRQGNIGGGCSMAKKTETNLGVKGIAGGEAPSLHIIRGRY